MEGVVAYTSLKIDIDIRSQQYFYNTGGGKECGGTGVAIFR